MAKPKTKSSKAVTVSKPTQQVAVRKEPSLMAIIADAAANPNCDVGKMRELLNLKKDIDAIDADKAFTKAFLAIQQDLPVIKSDRKIEIREKEGGQRTGRVQQSTPYATFQAIMAIVKPLLKKHGFTLSFSTEPSPDGTRIIVRGHLSHIGGHQRTTAFPLPAETSGSKNNVQGWGSSMSYGKRYCTIALLNIVSHAAQDADNDGHFDAEMDQTEQEPQKISPKHLEEIQAAIEFAGIDPVRIFEKYKVEKLVDIPANRHKDVLASIKSYKERKDRLSAEGQDKAN